VGGGGSKMAAQASPLFQVAGWRVKSDGSILPPHVMTRQNGPPGPAKGPPPITWPGEREGGKTRHFSKCWSITGYFKRPISQNISAKLAPSLLKCQSLPISFLRAVRRENVSYIVTRAYSVKDLPFSVGYTTFYRQHLCRRQWTQEQSRPQQHTWNSKLFVIIPAESTAAHSLHTQQLYVNWGYRFKTPIAKEAFSLAMFMFTS
jgi:hypothetical protein